MRLLAPLRLAGALATALIAALAAGALAATPAATPTATPLTVRIGFVAPLTGEDANYGHDLENGVQLALEDANAQGLKIGDQTAHFELVPLDDQGDPRLGMQAATQFTSLGVSAVVGHFNSGTAIPASRIYETAGIPMIDPAATNPALTSQGYANVFMVIANDAQNAGIAGAWAVDTMKVKRIAILDDRSAFGQGEADEFERTVRAHGGNVVAREFAASSTDDFATQLAKIRRTDADLVYFGGLARQAATVARQLKTLGMTPQFVGGGGVVNSAFVRYAGGAAEGTMSWEYGRPLAQLPDGPRFAQKYRSRYGTDVLAYAPFGYDAAWAAIHAMVLARSPQPDVFRSALKMISFDGVTGHIAFEHDGSLKNGSSTLYLVRKGVWVPVTTQGG